jgi:polyisoprenoid-binding protein YceI
MAFVRIKPVVVGVAVAWMGICGDTTASAAYGKEGLSTVSFTAVGPAGLRILGTTPELVVSDDLQRIEVKVPLANLTTGISLRDSHMRDKYLEVGKYPDARLTIDRASLRFPADGGDADATGIGALTLHGQVQQVGFHYRLSRRGQKTTVTGDLQLNMNKFGIASPSYLGLSVKPDVAVSVQFAVSEH